MDEGYIKFNCQWIKAAPQVSIEFLEDINSWREKLFELGLIGAYPDGIGFGNISKRINNHQFIITGSATGNIKSLNENHYALVTEYDLQKNSLICSGPIIASSESLSHAAIYESSSDMNALIHIHQANIWDKLKNKVPTTLPSAAYGTPEMAKEIKRLFKETDVLKTKIIIMGGHAEGIISFGKNMQEAGEAIVGLID